MQINPLDVPGQMFVIELLNPNPSSRRTKDGPVYRISFEVTAEVHKSFMDARQGNLRLIGRMAVAPDTDEQPAHDAIAPTEKPKKEKKVKEPTPHGAMWNELFRTGFTGCPGVKEAIADECGPTLEKPRDLLRRVFGVKSLSREVGPAEIYKRFPAKEFTAVKVMVEQALRSVETARS